MDYYTIKGFVKIEQKIKKSTFIASAYPTNSELKAKNYISSVKKEFYDSRHSPFAYIIKNKNILERYSDDGEPALSSGPPILNHLKGKKIVNIIVIVTRYFGGIKLGIGGLIRAYGSSTALVLEKANIIPYRLYHSVKIIYDYPDTNHVMHIIEKYNLKILENSYDERATIIVMIDEDTISSFIGEIETPTKPGIKTIILS